MIVKSDETYEVIAEVNEDKKITRYKLKVQKKDKKDNKIIQGAINCRFKFGVTLNNSQLIKIKDAKLDFYNNKKDVSIPYIFISDFELVNE